MQSPAGQLLCALVLIGFSTLTAPHARAADWYVDPGASGAADGRSLADAWTSLADVDWGAGGVDAGDVLHLRGGSYSEQLQPGASGAAGAPIEIRAYDGEPVSITGVPMCMRLHDLAYLRVIGISCDATGEYVDIRRSHHVEVAHGRFERSTRQDSWPVGFRLVESSHHNWIHHNVIGAVGYATSDDHGGVMNLGRWEDSHDDSHYNLIEHNVLFHGGHHVMEVSSAYNVIRHNHFHNEEWMSGGLYGNRHLVFDGPGDNTGWNLIEGNSFASCGVPPDDSGVAGVSLRSQHNIVRRNLFYDNDTAGLNLSSPGYHVTSYDPPGNVRNNHVYHNVMFHNGHATYVTDPGLLGGISFLQYGDSDEIELTFIKNNIMWDNNVGAISFESSSRDLQIIEDNWEEAGDPLFVDDEAAIVPAQPELLDFHLDPSSPCVDNGGFLTRTSGAGSGTTLPVEDAGYFTDGFGVPGVLGDLIQLEGQGVTARVVAVDHDADVLTLDTALFWSDGLGVAQPYVGARPDQGAFEHDPGGELDAGTATDAGVTPDARAGVDTGQAVAADAGSGLDAGATPEGCRCDAARAGHAWLALLLPGWLTWRRASRSRPR